MEHITIGFIICVVGLAGGLAVALRAAYVWGRVDGVAEGLGSCELRITNYE